MIGKRVHLLLITLLLMACAEPKYETKVVANPHSIVEEAALETCEVALEDLGLCVLWKWEEVPTSSKAGQLIFKVARPNELDGSPLPVEIPFDVALVLWMPDMGHGSTPTRVERVDVGSYRATDVFFVMPGEWDLRFQLKEEGDLRDEAIAKVSI